MSAVVRLEFDRRPAAVPYMMRGMLPVRRYVDLSPQLSARWRRHCVDRQELAIFHRVAGLPPAGPTLSLLYPHTIGFRLAMAVLTHPSFPVPIWGVLQVRNHVVQHRPIAVDECLDIETRVMCGRAVAKGAEFDLHTTVQIEAELAWESVVTFFARGSFGEPGPLSPFARSPVETGPRVAEWTMDDSDHWTFGRLTGDYNGIHLWDWYARRLGFRRALYHPPRVLGECLARLARADSAPGEFGPLRLDAWLKGPVPHAATVGLHATTAAGTCTFALFAGDARPSIVGRLTVPVVGFDEPAGSGATAADA